jgi:hypothetical protein
MIILTLHPSGEKVKVYRTWAEKLPPIEERNGFSIIGNLKVKETRSEIHRKLMEGDSDDHKEG